MQESIDAIHATPNRTGMRASPLHEEMNDVIQPVRADAGEAPAIAAVRVAYIGEANPLGSVSAEAEAQVEEVRGPQMFIDKLAERLAFERGGTRLYDAVIAKFLAHAQQLEGATVSELKEIRNEEASHAALLATCLEQMGADSTAQTPCADLAGVESSGLLQAATDPRTTLAQTLHAALAAELVDGAGWEGLIALAEQEDQQAMAERFRKALAQEERHLAKVQGWYDALILETTQPI